MRSVRTGLLLLGAVFALAGCAVPWQRPMLKDAYVLPPGISFAWEQDGELWIVPGKRQRIEDVAGEDWRSLKWQRAGEYVRVSHPPVRIMLRTHEGWKVLLREG